MSSRQAIIGAIQRGLKRGPLPADQRAMLAGRTAAHPRQLTPARGKLDLEGRIALFTRYAEREYATVARLESLAEVPRAVAVYLAAQNAAPALMVSDHPVLRGIEFAETPLLEARFGTAAPTDATCLTYAPTGIAETGTLMLPSGAATPTSNHLLPDNSLVVLHAGNIVPCYEDAFDKLRAQGAMPRNVMLVTGPSRSADIEQTLELGAHGPRRLHILIINGEG